MANTTKAYQNSNGVVFIDCGTIGTDRVGYALTDTGAIKLTGTNLTNEIASATEISFDGTALGKCSNAITYNGIGQALDKSGLELLMALIVEKSEDFD